MMHTEGAEVLLLRVTRRKTKHMRVGIDHIRPGLRSAHSRNDRVNGCTNSASPPPLAP